MTTWLENEYGFYKNIGSKYLIFFGKKNVSVDALKKYYSSLSFYEIKQTHSNICVDADHNTELQIADAHYSLSKNKALLIKTADCMPILAFDEATSTILSVHAGWRGIENQVTTESLKTISLKNPHFFIGPHILQDSFEVKDDAYNLLLKRARTYNLSFDQKTNFMPIDDGKYKINLLSIIDLELKSYFKHNPYSVDLLKIDTVTSPLFHSYRREKENAGRNISFIAQLS